MKRTLFLSLGALLISPAAQSDPIEIISSPSGSFDCAWPTLVGHTYFMQYSTTLTSWDFLPYIQEGTGDEMRTGFHVDAPRFFLRIISTDISTENASLADFDSDGIPNWVEVERLNTNPLLADTDGDGTADYEADRDGDGLTDYEEALFGRGSIFASDSDGDGLSDLHEFWLGSNAFNPDTDRDGVLDSDDWFIHSTEVLPPDPTPSTGPTISLISPNATLLP